MKNWIRIGLVLISLLMVNITNAQDNSIRPQLWNNIYLGWNINDNFIFTNAVAYNVLLSNGYPWNEYSYSGTASYTIKSWIRAGGGLYLASTRQSENLRSTEIRPFIALRLSTNANKRWLISNFSRMELRNLRYDKGNSNSSFRFRNRTYVAFSLNQETLLMDKNLGVFGYFEAFHNFDNDVVERFFTQYKYKIGFMYRQNFKWRFDLGVIYQEAKNNVVGPSISPVNIITNYIIDWGIAYIIAAKKD